MKIGFLGFYLDMDYRKVKSTMDSLLKTGDLQYFETTDLLGTRQKNLYGRISATGPFFYAKLNLKGSAIIDQRLTSIQLTLCTRIKSAGVRLSYNCAIKDVDKTFESYKAKYGKPEILGKGEKYDWLARKISDIYSSGPKGRLAMDKMYFWEKGDYIIYFDFGYPESHLSSDVPGDSTSAPIIYYDFTQDYIDKLLDRAGRNSK